VSRWRARIVAIAASVPFPLLAHEGEPHGAPAAAPGSGAAPIAETASTWTFDPVVLTLLAVSGALYLNGIRRSGSALRWWNVAAFAAGWLTIVAALVSPIDALSDVLFSAHMTQHELLMLVAAPLLVAGYPLVPMLQGLPGRLRPAATAMFRRPAVAATWRFLTNGLNVWVIHAIVIVVWHFPRFYEAAIRNEALHFFQHFTFLASAVFFWWALVHGRYGKLGYGMAFVYVFTTALYTGALGALFTFAPRLLYPIYGARSAAAGVDPIRDQQLAGLIMWVPAGAIMMILGLAFFAAWLGALEQRNRLTDHEGEAGRGEGSS
jgi:putative membrane protein